DASVEFIDEREGAMVNLALALARRALPWQAQLCPRALQDMEIARVQIFHERERSQSLRYSKRQVSELERAFRVQEEWKEAFRCGQSKLFESALARVSKFL
ncbi:unnamed protein product, partial [Choristocarpus tenellus]